MGDVVSSNGDRARVMGSIVIPAHDEESSIGATLRRLAPLVGQHEIVVVCNGCTDRTAEVVRSTAPWAALVELPEPGKSAALDAGDAAVSGFPRVYLDADVHVDATSVQHLIDTVASGKVVAAAATPVSDCSRSSLLVRSHYALRTQLLTNQVGLAGTGAMAVTAAGRARFTRWPAMIADDYFLDGQFDDVEKTRVASAPVVVVAPRTLRECVSRRARVTEGNARILGAGLRGPHRQAGLGSMAAAVRARPVLAVHVPAHLGITLAARGLVRWRRWRGTAAVWYRDDSRSPVPDVAP